MSYSQETPTRRGIPGGWVDTPAQSSANQSNRNSYGFRDAPNFNQVPADATGETTGPLDSTNRESNLSQLTPPSEGSTVVASPAHMPQSPAVEEEVIIPMDEDEKDDEKGGFAPIKAASSTKPERPALQQSASRRQFTEEDIFKALSRRRTSQSGGLSRQSTKEDEDAEQEEINKLMARMFGRTRQEHSEEEQTRHVGVVFKNLTVKGEGLGAALQPTVGDIFLGLPRLIKRLLAHGPKGAGGKPPVRTIIDDFTGCVKPGEMLLVLGRPGAGCSTFLKVLGNQRFGYKSVEGDVTYGGTDHHTMAKKYRSEVLYNPEDDLHYATLKVKNTLKFALETRAPSKESRKEGESKTAYINEFLRVVTKLFWIEHTMDTKVGNEFVRGVSGGEKKRVSIAEAMITKASTQCWDNSTRGLDASTALEYVQSLRSLTNMAHISTSVALYQAGESLWNCFDKVLLIDEGECCFFGPTDDAVRYFKDLGFEQPERWTSADFLTSVGDQHERHIRSGWEDRIPHSPQQFAEIFRKSKQATRNKEEIEDFEKDLEHMIEERHQAQTKATKRKNYTLGFHQQVWACTKRQFLVMIGDKQSLGKSISCCRRLRVEERYHAWFYGELETTSCSSR